MNNLLISIITPTLNGAKYLEECIQSIVAQNYPNIEHIVIDGGSTDRTVEILLNYQVKYPDLIKFISEPDKGIGDAWNKGFRIAKGDIFGHLGSDDISEPDAIQTVANFFKSNPNAYFVYGECIHIDGKGETLYREEVGDLDLKELINNSCMIPTCSSFYKREVIEKVGWVKDNGDDLDYWIRVAKMFPMHRIKNILSRYRIHSSQDNTSQKWNRENCLVSRQYGGSIFSGYCRRYYKSIIIEGLRPILGFTYPFINKIIGGEG